MECEITLRPALDCPCHFARQTRSFSSLYPLTSFGTRSIFDTFPPSLHPSAWTLGSIFSPGEPDTTPHVTRVSTCVLIQVQPVKTPTNIGVFVCIVVCKIQTPSCRSSERFHELQPDDNLDWTQRSKCHIESGEGCESKTTTIQTIMVVVVANNQNVKLYFQNTIFFFFKYTVWIFFPINCSF